MKYVSSSLKTTMAKSAMAATLVLALSAGAATAATVVTFNNLGGSSPFSYTNNGFTFTSGQNHVHLTANTIFNHSNCCSTPYIITNGGTFTLSEFNVVSNPDGFDLVGSNAAVFNVLGGVTGVVNFGNTFAGVTSVNWNENNQNSEITSATFNGVAAVPEPSSLALVGAGILGLGLLRRRQA